MELFNKLQGLTLVNMVRQAKLYPFFRTLEGSIGNNVTHKGKNLVMMSSNNYLGLTHDPRVINAAVEAVKFWGTGCTGSRFLNGNLSLHEKLEKKLAEFLGTESALVFASGFLANQGAIPALAHKGDYIFSDGDNHACIIEGCKASDAETLVYRHNDMEHLEQLLKSVPADCGKLIVTDGVFSMTGKTAKYDQIYNLAKKYNARTFIDDAHGLGVVGVGGRGTANMYNLPVDVIMGTFSKSMASQGGFIAGSAELIDWLRHNARSFMFSAALAPASTAAALKALEVLMEEPERVVKANANAEYFKKGLQNLGIDTMGSPTTIIPVLVGDDSVCLGVCQTLLKLGIFTTPVVYPAVPRGQALIRCSVMPTHTEKDLDIAIGAFAQVAPAILAANAAPNTNAIYEEMNNGAGEFMKSQMRV
ncbi:MAG: aminotransferase class I/II-fold pyridoxal phosphate-dependent enzyme [Oligoflexia bacterium]|nr:aminotransferase class I/II-fold pyridoxal phosphate-dependent enzyme [Oligoflexia bacterium]